jgi:hypothetical protein
MTPALRIKVYDKAYVYKGAVARPHGVNVLLLWNAPGLAEFSLDSDAPRVAALATTGARCVIERLRPDNTWVAEMSGLVTEAAGGGGSLDGTRTFSVLDDWTVLNEIVGYPVPANPLSSQSGSAYDVRFGPVESVLKGFVTSNVSGQSFPKLTVQVDTGAGPTVTRSVRMHTLAERLWPMVSTAGLGVRVIQSGSTRELQTWIPATHARELTEASGIVASVEFSRRSPEVTRVVVGIGGEGTARQFYGPFVNTTVETAWGIRRAEFIDARDIETTDPDRADLAEERAQERLTEGSATASLKAELAETGTFRYGTAYNLGDKVTIRPVGSDPITDRVREVELDWSTDNGLVITPRIGEWQDSQTDRLWRTVDKTLRATNDLGTR